MGSARGVARAHKAKGHPYRDRGRIRVGASGGSRVSSPDSASGSRPAPSGRSFSGPASTLRRGGRRRRGVRFFARRQSGIMACDFLTVDTVLFRRLYMLVLIELATRQVHLAGITPNPTGNWVTQQARNIVETFVERTEPIRFLIHDRDSKFAAAFDGVPHTVTGAERDAFHRTLDRQRPSRVPRPAPDRESPPPRARPPGLHRALQHASPTPLPPTAATSWRHAAGLSNRPHSRPDSRPRRTRRAHPRIQKRCVRTVELGFRHPRRPALC